MASLIALGCALTWSITVILFKVTGERVHPINLNFFKNTMGVILMIPTCLLIEGRLDFWSTSSDFLMLLLSGAIGIGLADYMFLTGLNKLGAARTAVVDCLYSPFVILLAVVFLGESLTWLQGIGVSLVISGVFFAVKTKDISLISSQQKISGGIIAGTSILLMAAGISIVKPLFGQLPLFWIILIRLVAGWVFSGIVWLLSPERHNFRSTLFDSDQKTTIFLASFLATYVSMILWVAGFKYNDATIAAVLNQTATIFTIILAAVFLKEKLSLSKIIASVMAIAGVLLISLA